MYSWVVGALIGGAVGALTNKKECSCHTDTNKSDTYFISEEELDKCSLGNVPLTPQERKDYK